VGSGQRPEPALQALNETLERRVAERTAHLRERDELLRALTDNSPDPIYVKDAQSRWLLANPAVLRIVGKTAEEAIGKTDLELHRDPSIGQAILENDRRIMSAGRAEAVEEVADSVEGRRVYLSIKAPWPDGRGGIAGIVGISRDITERKRVEEELRNANALLTEADRRKDAFLASLSHELRNPLAPIANSLYVLDHAAPGGEQADRAKQVICRQVLQLSNLVNDLLDVTRIARGKATLQKERLELNEVVRRAVEDNRSLFDRAGVRLELASEACAIRMVADRTRIVQIVGNLLQNSAKFTHRGGRTRVSVAVLAHQAVVRVVDDGVGIAPETVALLFQPFTQAAQTLDRSRCGLGLGLALVKGLVELHGGTVSAHSEGLGCGTEMVVRLPVEASTALQDEESPSPVTRCRRRVLIIEDNADTAASLSEVLGFGQHEVAIAHDGPDGLAQARAFRPDVVLCDIGLPGMSGYDVARVFREDEELRGTVLVALSGYALPEDVLRAAEAGFACHLAKPPSLEKLEALLASLPAESASASTASRGPPASA
jgi:two-component system CheB/CheR fusion protein